jgi:hypothetical protein
VSRALISPTFIANIPVSTDFKEASSAAKDTGDTADLSHILTSRDLANSWCADNSRRPTLPHFTDVSSHFPKDEAATVNERHLRCYFGFQPHSPRVLRISLSDHVLAFDGSSRLVVHPTV